MKQFSSFLLLLLWFLECRADCFDEAASFHQVNPTVLRAIVYQESKFIPGTLNRNTNSTVDVGLAGVNSVHFDELRKYDIEPNDLLNPCKSIYVGAWLLSKKIRRYGNNWVAIGSYHSETPYYRDIYANKIKAIVNYWISNGLAAQAPSK